MSEKFVAKPTLKIDGTDYSSDTVIEDLLQIVVEESLHLPGMFTLVIQNDYYGGTEDHEVWKHESSFPLESQLKLASRRVLPMMRTLMMRIRVPSSKAKLRP